MVRTGAGSQRVLTTVAFTDIVGSTEIAARIGDVAFSAVLDKHDRLAGAAIRRHHGRSVNSYGDGVLAAFDSPADAIAAVTAAGRAVAKLDLHLRAGIHTGECEQRGETLSGIAVHTAARIAALAGPDEVVVSATVRDLVAGSGLEFSSRGEHDLRGVPGRWQLFAVDMTSVKTRARPATGGAKAKSAVRTGIAIMLVDDHPMWRDTLRKVLAQEQFATVVAEASDGADAAALAVASRPDVVIMDMNLPTIDGVEAIRQVLAVMPEVRVLVLSSSDERGTVVRAVRAGASGYLLKTTGPSEVVEAVRRVHAGEMVFPPGLADVVLAAMRDG